MGSKPHPPSTMIVILLAVSLAAMPAAAIASLAGQAMETATQVPSHPLALPHLIPSASIPTFDRAGFRPLEASPVTEPGWEALSRTQSGVSPPDVQIAVGPDHVVEAVNSALGVYTKDGGSPRNTNFSVLFSSGGDLVGDPRVLYDVFSGRWFLSAGDFSLGQVLVAVSKTSDPSGDWWTTRVPSAPTGVCLDQPILSVGTWNVIVSVNVYSSCTSPTNTFNGAQYWVLNKTELVAGVANPATWASLRNTVQFSVHPVRMESPSPIQYMVSTLWAAPSPFSVTLQSFAVSGSPPGAVGVTVTDHPIAEAQLPPPATQKGSFYDLDTGDFRIADALWSHGVLWLAFNDECQTRISRTACARLIELDTEANAIRQDFRVSSALRHYFYPALALDGSGDLAVVVAVSSSTEYPGISVTGRLRGDPAGEFQPPIVVKPGLGPEELSCSAAKNRCRYGDYFGANPDPSDPSRVWLAGQFGRGVNLGWGTYILPARIKAMLTVNYSVDAGSPPVNGPLLHYVRNGTPASMEVHPAHATVLADPDTAWQIDSSFMTTSGDRRYLVSPSDEGRLHGVANRSVIESVSYQLQYPVTLDVTSGGGSVGYAFNGTAGTVESGRNDTFFVFPGDVVTLTARPSSLLYVFSGWSGDANGSVPSQSVTVGRSQSIAARFAPNWALITAMVTTGGVAIVASAVFFWRRRKAKPAAVEVVTPPLPPPSGPAP